MRVIYATPGSGKTTFAEHVNGNPLMKHVVVIDTDAWRHSICGSTPPEQFESKDEVEANLRWLQCMERELKREVIIITNICQYAQSAKDHGWSYIAIVNSNPYNRPNEDQGRMLEFAERLTNQLGVEAVIKPHIWACIEAFWNFVIQDPNVELTEENQTHETRTSEGREEGDAAKDDSGSGNAAQAGEPSAS